jgi:glutamate racemase
LLIKKIKTYLPEGITLFSQGEHVAESLVDYLKRHPEIDDRLTRRGQCRFLTTESAEKFSSAASIFLNQPIKVEEVAID